MYRTREVYRADDSAVGIPMNSFTFREACTRFQIVAWPAGEDDDLERTRLFDENGAEPVRPDAGYFDKTMGEFILRYEDARQSTSPENAVLEFFQSTYEAAAGRANWDRGTLESVPGRETNR